MKIVTAANTWDEAAALLDEFGPLVSLQVAAYGLGVTYSRVYALCEAGQLRCVAVCGVYHVPFSDVQERKGKGGLRIAHSRDNSLACDALTAA